LYRRRAGSKAEAIEPAGKSPSPRALQPGEKQAVLDILHSERFVDKAPHEVYASLLDEGTYHCSIRTMYRILEGQREVKERRDQLRHPVYEKPELLANAPNQVWSWDITKLLGPAKWTYFYLYVILDIFSRYVVGWMVATHESAQLATRFLEETCLKQEILPGQLTIHADRGSSMKSKPVAFLLSDLGITKTHSRPYTSDDNPFSESHFKTLKYRPIFPSASEPSKMPAVSASVSFPGTTRNITIPGSACSPPKWFTLDTPPRFYRKGTGSCSAPTNNTLKDLSTKCRLQNLCRQRLGSIRPSS
jgi:putative transposase